MNYIDQIAAMGACPNALDWLDGAKHSTLQEAWNACFRADWMLWLFGHGQAVPREKLVLCACDIAETVLIHIPAGEDRPRTAIETARRWARGEASIEEVRSAHADAFAAYVHATIGAAAGAAAAAAVHATRTAYTLAHSDAAVQAANYTTEAAGAAAYAAYGATLTDAAADADAASADIVRRHFPAPPELTGASQ